MQPQRRRRRGMSVNTSTGQCNNPWQTHPCTSTSTRRRWSVRAYCQGGRWCLARRQRGGGIRSPDPITHSRIHLGMRCCAGAHTHQSPRAIQLQQVLCRAPPTRHVCQCGTARRHSMAVMAHRCAPRSVGVYARHCEGYVEETLDGPPSSLSQGNPGPCRVT